MTRFFDAILLGDGEEAIVEIAECIRVAKKEQLSRPQTLERLAAVPGVYIPSFYSPSYKDDGTIAEMKTLNPKFPTVRRRVLADLSAVDHLLHPLVPNGKIVRWLIRVSAASETILSVASRNSSGSSAPPAVAAIM